MSSQTLARRLSESTGTHTVLSLFFDLNPDEFATAPARATQVNSLMDAADRDAKALDGLDHDAEMALRDDLARVREYLGSDDLPVSDARAIAVYASKLDDLFETVVLSAPAGPAVTLASHAVLEPLVARPPSPGWCAVLAAEDRAEIYLGRGDQVSVSQHEADYIRGSRAAGGPTGHDKEQDIEDHLLDVARALLVDWRRARFGVLALGGPVNAVTRLDKALDNDLRPALLEQRLEIDPSAANVTELAAAVDKLVAADTEARHRELLARFTDGLADARGSSDRTPAIAGAEAVTEALTEGRVATLLLGDSFRGDQREAAIRGAVATDAEVVTYDDQTEELSPARPVGALLRF